MTNDLASHTLSEFQVNVKTYVKTVKDSKEPMLLTENGEVEAVLVDLVTYKELQEVMERARYIAAIKEGLEDVAAGRTRPASEALNEIRAKHGLHRRTL